MKVCSEASGCVLNVGEAGEVEDATPTYLIGTRSV
jgi:hypothetical protein